MKKILSLVLVLAMGLSMAACTGSKSKSDLEYVKDKGTLVVGITEFAPMDYKDENGKWIGFDADMATAFAKSLGVEVEFVIIDWDNKTMISSKTLPYSLVNKNVKPILYNGMIYVNESYSSSYNLILMYNPNDGSIAEITCTVPLYNKAYLCATLCGDKIYYFGGGNKEAYAFSPRTREFEKLADMPLPLNRAICVASNELIYVIGGLWKIKWIWRKLIRL